MWASLWCVDVLSIGMPVSDSLGAATVSSLKHNTGFWCLAAEAGWCDCRIKLVLVVGSSQLTPHLPLRSHHLCQKVDFMCCEDRVPVSFIGVWCGGLNAFTLDRMEMLKPSHWAQRGARNINNTSLRSFLRLCIIKTCLIYLWGGSHREEHP